MDTELAEITNEIKSEQKKTEDTEEITQNP